jgi:hypothetical protein
VDRILDVAVHHPTLKEVAFLGQLRPQALTYVLYNTRKISTLCFQNCTISQAIVNALKEGFRSNGTITRLELRNVHLEKNVVLQDLFREARIQGLLVQLAELYKEVLGGNVSDSDEDDKCLSPESVFDALSFPECSVQTLAICASSYKVGYKVTNVLTFSRSLERLLRTTSFDSLRLSSLDAGDEDSSGVLCSHLIEGLRHSKTIRTLHPPTMHFSATERLWDALVESNQLENLHGIVGPYEDWSHVASSLSRIKGLKRISFRHREVEWYSRETVQLFIQAVASNDTLESIDCEWFDSQVNADIRRVVQLKRHRIALVASINSKPGLAPVALRSLVNGPREVFMGSLLYLYVHELAGIIE